MAREFQLLGAGAMIGCWLLGNTQIAFWTWMGAFFSVFAFGTAIRVAAWFCLAEIEAKQSAASRAKISMPERG